MVRRDRVLWLLLPAAAEFRYVVINADYIRRYEPGGPFDEFYRRLARRDGYSSRYGIELP